MKIERIGYTLYRINNNYKHCYVSPNGDPKAILKAFGILGLSAEEIGKAIILIFSSLPEQEAEIFNINYEDQT